MDPPGDESALRAGDRDRERAAEDLRRHHLAGRIDSDELDERLGLAYGARTLGDLRALLRDLPALAPPRALPGPPAPRPKVGGLGLLRFSQVHDLPVAPEKAFAEAMHSVTRAMVASGYDLVGSSDGRSLEFVRRERPAWVYAVCVAGFPFGLFALTVKRTTRVRIDLAPLPGGGSRLLVSGVARRPVRKAFAELSSGPS